MKLKKKKGWADRRFAKAPRPAADVERLVGCYIERGDAIHGIAGKRHHSHASVRMEIGDQDPYVERRGDICGYLTSTGRLVDRHEGATVAILANQAAPMYEGRAILSSDIRWY